MGAWVAGREGGEAGRRGRREGRRGRQRWWTCFVEAKKCLHTAFQICLVSLPAPPIPHHTLCHFVGPRPTCAGCGRQYWTWMWPGERTRQRAHTGRRSWSRPTRRRPAVALEVPVAPLHPPPAPPHPPPRPTRPLLPDPRPAAGEAPPLLAPILSTVKLRAWTGGPRRPPTWARNPFPKPRLAGLEEGDGVEAATSGRAARGVRDEVRSLRRRLVARSSD